MRVFFSPERTLAFDPARVHALFEAFGSPAALKRKKRPDAEEIARALWGGVVPEELAAALARVARFGNARGRDALVDAAHDARAQGHFDDGAIERALARAFAPLAAWLDLPPGDLALALVTAREPALEAIFERAEIALARLLPEHIPFELTARGSTSLPDEAAIAEALGGDAWVVKDDDGAFVIAALRDEAAHAAYERGKRVVTRSVAADLIRLDPVAARLTITTSRPAMVGARARALAGALGLEPDAFVQRPALTLKRIAEMDVAIVALQAHDGRGRRVDVHGGEDVAKALARLTKRGGYVSCATLRFAMDGGANVDAYVELPNRLSVSDARFERPVRAALDALGVFRPGAVPDDIATLAPWIHPEWRWRAVVGDAAFDAMVKKKLLVKVRASRVAREEDAWLGAGVRAFELTRTARDRGKHYAIPAHGIAAPRTVASDDLVAWKLRSARVASRMRKAMRLRKADDAAIGLPSGVLEVGVLPLDGASRARVLRLVRAVADDEREKLGAAIRFACGKDAVVVLVPAGRTLGNVLAEVELTIEQQLGIGTYEGVVLRAARQLRVADELESVHFATKESPLVVWGAKEEVTLGRVRLSLTKNQFALILALAKSGARPMHVDDLGKAIAGGVGYPDVVARKALRDLDERVAKSFADAGEKLPAAWRKLVVGVGREGYRLAVGAIVR